MILFNLIIASFLVTLASALQIQGKIIPNALIDDLSKLDSTTTWVVLDGARYTTRVRANGEFTFHNVEPGSYLLEVQSIKYVFPKMRVDINAENKVRAAYSGLNIDWNQRGYSVQYPLEVQAKAESDYFMVKQGFNVLGMFKNPMMIMIAFSGIAMFFMPKMMKQLQDMDPEAVKEMSQSQADAQKMLSEMPGLSQMFSNR